MLFTDVAGFKDRREQSLRNGKLRGLGYACYIEACGIAPSNVAGSLGAGAARLVGITRNISQRRIELRDRDRQTVGRTGAHGLRGSDSR